MAITKYEDVSHAISINTLLKEQVWVGSTKNDQNRTSDQGTAELVYGRNNRWPSRLL